MCRFLKIVGRGDDAGFRPERSLSFAADRLGSFGTMRRAIAPRSNDGAPASSHPAPTCEARAALLVAPGGSRLTRRLFGAMVRLEKAW